MYLTFDLLEPATLLAIEFIDAVCGHGKEFFGLKVITTIDGRVMGAMGDQAPTLFADGRQSPYKLVET